MPSSWQESYWFALGKFVHRYAELEGALHRTLGLVAEVDELTAQALFSGTRVKGAVDFVKRIKLGREEALSPWLAKAFPKVTEITTARDRLLHYGFQIEDQAAVVTDAGRNLPARSFTMTMSVDDLDSLETDTITCIACLAVDWYTTAAPGFDGSELQHERDLASRPWRFVLPSQPHRPRTRTSASDAQLRD